MLEINKIYNDDCLIRMKDIDDGSIDMILCDLPYGKTANDWDVIIDIPSLWGHYKRVIKDNGAIVLFGDEPFSSRLRLSNERMYRYDWKWKKSYFTGFLNANKMPLKANEDIMVYYKKLPTYNPQKRFGFSNYNKKNKGREISSNYQPGTKVYDSEVKDGSRMPINIIEGIGKVNHGDHPTQKPVKLMEYLIKTYTNEGDLVLDNCIGSGTTAVACVNLNRNFIGIEMDETYYKVACDRVAEAKKNHEVE